MTKFLSCGGGAKVHRTQVGRRVKSSCASPSGVSLKPLKRKIFLGKQGRLVRAGRKVYPELTAEVKELCNERRSVMKSLLQKEEQVEVGAIPESDLREFVRQDQKSESFLKAVHMGFETSPEYEYVPNFDPNDEEIIEAIEEELREREREKEEYLWREGKNADRSNSRNSQELLPGCCPCARISSKHFSLCTAKDGAYCTTGEVIDRCGLQACDEYLWHLQDITFGK